MKLFKISLSTHGWNSAMKFILFALIIFSFSCTTVHNAKQSSDAKIDAKRKLTAGENHLYTVHLNPEEFIHIRIIQNGIDVIAKVSSEDKQYAEQFDSPMAQYANTMRSLGFVYIRQKNYEEAINTFKSLLPVWNQVGDV